MIHRFLPFLCLCLLIVSCQSREFKTVSVQDEVKQELNGVNPKNLEDARALIAKGNLAFQKSEFNESIRLASEANQKVETAEGYALLGASEYRLGNYSVAEEAYLLGKRLDADNQKILIGLGTVQATLGKYEDAVQTYETLVKINPEEPVYKYKVGTLLKLQRKYQESYVTLKPLRETKDFPYPVELLNQLGDVCVELKKYEEAEIYFAEAEKLQPESKSSQNAKEATRVAGYIQKGNDALNKKNYDLAISEYRKGIDLQPNNASLHTFLGTAYFLKGTFSESETSFRKSISLQDNHIPAYLGLCNLYIKKNQYADCQKVSELGLTKSPRNAELKNKLGICQWKWGQSPKAILSFQDASSIDPNFFEPKINLAYLLIDLGRNDEALEALKKAESHPHADKEAIQKAKIFAESQMYIKEGDTFLRQGRKKQALDLYGKALGRNPEDPSAHNAFGKAFFAFGDFKKSESSYKEALRLDEKNLLAIQGLARVYAKLGDSKKENEFVNRLQSLAKNDPYAAITLGRIAEDSGRFEEAEKIYLDLQKKNPENEAIQFRLANLYYKRAVEENDQEKYKQALETIQKSKKLSKEIPEVNETENTIKENLRFAEIIPYVREGNKAFDKKRYDDAITAYTKAHDKVPKPSLLVKVAECYMAKGEEEKGISILEKAAKENRDQASSFREGIFAYFYKKGETSKAEEGFHQILKEKPDSFYSYYMLGLISMKKKDWDLSINQLDKSILLNGNFAPANVAKGLVYYRTEKPAEAKREFEKAKNKDNQFSLSSYNLAIAYFNEDLIEESKEVLEGLRKSDPDFSDGEIHLAYIYFKQGKLKEAEDSILNVLKDDRNPEALYAYFTILSEKQKSSPNEKTLAKRNAIREEIRKNHPDTKYARMLPVDEEGIPAVITELQLAGTPKQDPILYPNRIIINYGESIVALDRKTKEQVWKIFTPDPFTLLVASKQLVALKRGLLQKIYPDSGALSTNILLNENESIVHGEVFEDHIYLLSQNQKTKEMHFQILSFEGVKEFESKEKDILSFSVLPQGEVFIIRDKKKEFLFQSLTYDTWTLSNKTGTFLKGDTKEIPRIYGCLVRSCLLQTNQQFLEVDINAKVTSLAKKGTVVLSYRNEDSIHLRTSESLLVWKAEGKWSEVLTGLDFRHSFPGASVDAKGKELLVTKDSQKKSLSWTPEKDGKRISTIRVESP
ncbi:TPR-repeat-containing lipoprotein [Leptospira ryugenii]|uniref:TPR-repeat-containing lipoprotein n=1 Tax=Leptospira ryugenii TaxID=1917863 RepID=A0A2P2E1U3_9LEPT|nr:tetratricopeptide repeat protein [Leptospira ryugenii]GBF50858.1 TPR-repeat-containing lipoprotein [Leptospira ryugenii]